MEVKYMENEESEENPKKPMSDVKFAIIGLVSITALATGVMIYHGVGTEQIDLVFTGAICAIAGLVSTK